MLRDLLLAGPGPVPDFPLGLHCPDCPALELPELPTPNFWLGLVVGFLLWPLLELLLLVKQCVVLALRSRIASYSCGTRLYKVLG